MKVKNLFSTVLCSVAACLLVVHPTSSRAAEVVTLECVATEGNPLPRHNLLDIDYNSKMIRSYIIDDDGRLIANWKYPINVTENEITWTEPTGINSGYSEKKLGRYSGKLTGKFHDPNGRVLGIADSECHRYHPPKREKQF